jgi:2,5-diamino-6-(ribosylamino)-4(3H)-pyrimidinone 5'-phosphate reductase
MLMVAKVPVDGLNGEWKPASMDLQPRPVILDPHCRAPLKKLRRLVSKGEAKSPWIFCQDDVGKSEDDRYIPLKTYDGKFKWEDILSTLAGKGAQSVMIEGGAVVINDILTQRMADVIIITIAPVFLGTDGVGVLPTLLPEWLEDVQSISVGNDIVVAGRIKREAKHKF